jgi:excisionase family DNA binding protein
MSRPPTPPSALLLDVVDVASMLGVSPRSIVGWVASGSFPAPLCLGRLKRWRRQDVETHLATLAAAAKGGHE